VSLRKTVSGNPWASASAVQEVVPAGQRGSLTLTPYETSTSVAWVDLTPMPRPAPSPSSSHSMCAYASPSGQDYHADIMLTSSGTDTHTITYTNTGIRLVRFLLNT
jgi:hypothetical protein